MIKTKEDYFSYLEKDKRANNIKDNTFLSFMKSLLIPNYIWKFQKSLRKCEYLKNSKPNVIKKLIFIFHFLKYQRLALKLGFSIPLNVFGPGLSLPHYGTIIVNSNVIVGKNCRLHAGVNIGASGGSTDAPQIGDNVYIGPGAIIFGNIEIGNSITIGANATVNRSFLIENSVLAGTPAKVVKRDFPVWWLNNRMSLV